MSIVVAILLALFVLPRPWGWAAVGLTVAYELATGWLGWHWSRTRTIAVGPEALVGAIGEVTAACRPDGWVRVAGELWRARCPGGAATGAAVRVLAVDGLTLVVGAE